MWICKPLQSDVEAVMKIETFSPSPWSSVAINDEFVRQNGVQFVAVEEKDKHVVGWCSARVIDEEAELLKIAVDARKRRLGIASALLFKLVRECKKRGARKLFLEVRANNEPARAFYHMNGFAPLHIRKNYYRNPKDDAVIYKKRLS